MSRRRTCYFQYTTRLATTDNDIRSVVSMYICNTSLSLPQLATTSCRYDVRCDVIEKWRQTRQHPKTHVLGHVQTPPPPAGRQYTSLCLSVCVSVCVTVWVWLGVARSVEAAAAQIVGNDDVGDCVKDELDVGGVGGTRLVTVDLLRRALVLRLELCLDVRCRLLVRLRTYMYT